jgi:hypothetical protein
MCVRHSRVLSVLLSVEQNGASVAPWSLLGHTFYGPRSKAGSEAGALILVLTQNMNMRSRRRAASADAAVGSG